MKFQILTSVLILLALNSAEAFPDVCALAEVDVTRAPVSAEEISAYRAKISNECGLSEKYRQMVRKANERFGLSLEQISVFEAMRYVDRDYYEGAKASNTPLRLIYQTTKSAYSLPLEQRSSRVWDNFQRGIRQLNAERERVANGGRYELKDVLRVHAGFYPSEVELRGLSKEQRDMALEVGDYAHEPLPGQIKPAYGNDRHWWLLDAEKVDSTKKLIAEINEAYSNMGLIGSQMDRLYGDPYVNDVLSVRQTKDGGMGFYGGDTKTNQEHLANLFNMVNTLLAQARQGQYMVWKGRLYTPGQLAFLTQQFLVQTHPLHEGNGRVSRFTQELILTLFSLPPGSSGDLMNIDVLSTNAEYYRTAMLKSYDLLTETDDCLERVYPQATRPSIFSSVNQSRGRKNEAPKPVVVPPPISVFSLDQTTLEYDCRILN